MASLGLQISPISLNQWLLTLALVGDKVYSRCVHSSCADCQPFSPAVAIPTAITCGTVHTCVLLNSGGVMCWGLNDYGQVGTGNISDIVGPTTVKLNAGSGDFGTCFNEEVAHEC